MPGVTDAVVFVLAAVWEGKLHPATPRFARAQPPTSTRQFREDANARVFTDHSGSCLSREASSSARPVLLASTPSRLFWW